MTQPEKLRSVSHALRRVYVEACNRMDSGRVLHDKGRIHVYDKYDQHVLSMSDQTLKDYSK